MGSVVLPHLVTGWHVDQAIMSEEERLVVIRFGRDWDPDCMRQDEVLYRAFSRLVKFTYLGVSATDSVLGIADRVENFAVIYVCDLDQVPDFKQMYELYDPVTLMFFFRNKHMMCDFGTGNNNKLNWVLDDKQELIDIIETIYRGAKKGRGLVISPKGKSHSYNQSSSFIDLSSEQTTLQDIGISMVLTRWRGRRSSDHIEGFKEVNPACGSHFMFLALERYDAAEKRSKVIFLEQGVLFHVQAQIATSTRIDL